jgi:hypothetical protein
MTGLQASLLVIPEGALGVLAEHLELVKYALDDAAAWREHLEDTEAADAYRELAAEIERAEEGS